MRIGSHNTMSYLRPATWWGRLLRFTAQCQGKNIYDQFELGVRTFDLRVVFDKKTGEPHFAHGLITYESADVYGILDYLNMQAISDKLRKEDEPIYIRILNERNKDYDRFVSFCSGIEKEYKSLRFFGGHNKKDWRRLYTFKNPDPSLIDKYSSCNNDLVYYSCLGELLRRLHLPVPVTGWHLDDLFPRIYAWAFNEYWRDVYDGTHPNDTLLQDFVGVY